MDGDAASLRNNNINQNPYQIGCDQVMIDESSCQVSSDENYSVMEAEKENIRQNHNNFSSNLHDIAIQSIKVEEEDSEMREEMEEDNTITIEQ